VTGSAFAAGDERAQIADFRRVGHVGAGSIGEFQISRFGSLVRWTPNVGRLWWSPRSLREGADFFSGL